MEKAGIGALKPPEQYLEDAVEGLEIRSVIDVGTGHGGVFALGYWESKALERKACLDIAYIRPDTPPGWSRIIATAERLPLKDKSFDLVQSTEMIEHIDPARHPRVLAELERVARKAVFITSTDETKHMGEAHRRFVEWNPHNAYMGIVEKALLEQRGYRILLDDPHHVKAFKDTLPTR